MKEHWTIGFLGFGNMARALAQGFVRSGFPGERMVACAKRYGRLCENAAPLGVRPVQTAAEVAAQADLVIVAVKPYLVEEVVSPLRGALRDKAVVSVASGVFFDRYEEILAPGTQHISTIPNTPVAVCEGAVVCEQKHSLGAEAFEAFTSLFGKVGLLEFVETSKAGAASTISGCGPAWAAMFLEALGDAAVKYGVPRENAYRLAAQMICGTGRLYLESGRHPGAMKDAVCSPGGTTIRGVSALEKAGFRGAVIGAVDEIEGK